MKERRTRKGEGGRLVIGDDTFTSAFVPHVNAYACVRYTIVRVTGNKG